MFKRSKLFLGALLLSVITMPVIAMADHIPLRTLLSHTPSVSVPDTGTLVLPKIGGTNLNVNMVILTVVTGGIRMGFGEHKATTTDGFALKATDSIFLLTAWHYEGFNAVSTVKNTTLSLSYYGIDRTQSTLPH